VSEPKPKLIIIVVNWNRKALLSRCLHSLKIHLRFPYEVVVVDNGSTDGSPELLKKKFPEVKIIENKENVGFARANNQALNYLHNEGLKANYVLFLNNDVVLKDDSIQRLIDFMDEEPEVIASCPAVFITENLPQVGVGGFEPTLYHVFNYAFFLSRLCPPYFPSIFINQPYYLTRQRPVEVDWVSGVCLLSRFSLWDKVAGWPEISFMYAEDIALGKEIRKWGKIVYFPGAKVYHVKEVKEERKEREGRRGKGREKESGKKERERWVEKEGDSVKLERERLEEMREGKKREEEGKEEGDVKTRVANKKKEQIETTGGVVEGEPSRVEAREPAAGGSEWLKALEIYLRSEEEAEDKSMHMIKEASQEAVKETPKDLPRDEAKAAKTPGKRTGKQRFKGQVRRDFNLFLIKIILWLGFELRGIAYWLWPSLRHKRSYSFQAVKEARAYLRHELGSSLKRSLMG